MDRLHKKLYDMWSRLKPILEKHKINYFADGGTLLGAYREGQIIGHDDDIDIGTFEQDKHKLFSKEFQQDLKNVNLQFNSEQYVYKIFPTDNLHKIFIDIFVYNIRGEKIFLASESHNKSWPNSYFYKDELFPLIDYNFGKEKIAGAYKPINYFRRQYGEDWYISKKSHIHHDIDDI